MLRYYYEVARFCKRAAQNPQSALNVNSPKPAEELRGVAVDETCCCFPRGEGWLRARFSRTKIEL